MEEKLKSITSQTHWSLLLKSIGFALAWSVLPYWLFVVAGLAFYFLPFFGSERMIVPFLALLVFAAFIQQGFFATLFFATAYFLIMGVKDLVFIDRGSAYEAVLLLMLTAFSLLFFSHSVNTERVSSFATAIIGAYALYVFFRGLMAHDAPESEHRTKDGIRRMFLGSGVCATILFQGFIAVLFLPMNFFLQSALIVLLGAALVSALRDYISGRFDARVILAYAGIWIAGTSAVLLLTTWSV
jgi:hypothetical protein